jgi:hypothetical protein
MNILISIEEEISNLRRSIAMLEKIRDRIIALEVEEKPEAADEQK